MVKGYVMGWMVVGALGSIVATVLGWWLLASILTAGSALAAFMWFHG